MYIERSLTVEEAYKMQRNADKIQYARVTYPLPHDIVKPVLTMSVLDVAAGNYKEEIQQIKNFLHQWSNLEQLRQIRKENKPGHDVLAYVNRRSDLIQGFTHLKKAKPGVKITRQNLSYSNTTYLLSKLRYSLGMNEMGYTGGFAKLQNRISEIQSQLSMEGKLMVASVSFADKVGLARFIQLPKIDDKGRLQLNHYNLREAIVQHLGKIESSRSRYRLVPVNSETGGVVVYEDATHFYFQLDRMSAKTIATVSIKYQTPLELASKMFANMSVPHLPGDRSQEVKDALAKVYALIPVVK